jgi:hypothetical protein
MTFSVSSCSLIHVASVSFTCLLFHIRILYLIINLISLQNSKTRSGSTSISNLFLSRPLTYTKQTHTISSSKYRCLVPMTNKKYVVQAKGGQIRFII